MLAAIRNCAFLPALGVAASGAYALSHESLISTGLPPSPLTALADSPSPPKPLDPAEWKKLKLSHRQQLTPTTHLFRLDFPDKNAVANLPVASCLTVKGLVGTKEDGAPEVAIRPYTPVSAKDARGHIDLVVKVYPTGKVSKYFGALKVGQEVEVKGPFVKLEYKPNMKKSIGLIGGGSGLTPLLQVAEEILNNPSDRTEVSLIYANVSEAEIILKERLDRLAAQHKNFKVYYVVDKATSKGWKGGEGHVSADIVKSRIAPPSNDTLVMVCGPPGFMKAVSGDKVSPKDQGEVVGILKDLGYTKEQVFKF